MKQPKKHIASSKHLRFVLKVTNISDSSDSYLSMMTHDDDVMLLNVTDNIFDALIESLCEAERISEIVNRKYPNFKFVIQQVDILTNVRTL